MHDNGAMKDPKKYGSKGGKKKVPKGFAKNGNARKAALIRWEKHRAKAL